MICANPSCRKKFTPKYQGQSVCSFECRMEKQRKDRIREKAKNTVKFAKPFTKPPLVGKANVIRWPDADRLRMIDKSEFYSEPRVYQYGYYDGYQIQSEKIDRAVKLIQEARQNSDRSDAILQDAIILLLGQACL